MDSSYRLKHQQLEKSHFWFQARRDMVLRLLKETSPGSRILDVGCCGGSLLKTLEKSGFVNADGVDLSKVSISSCKKSGLKNVHLMDAKHLQFDDNEFDVIVASDVMEHINDDLSAMKECFRVLKKGGKLIVFVPAFGFLWSAHDDIVHHHRRYSRSQLVSKLEKSGFEITGSSYWNFLLFFPSLIFTCVQRIAGNRNRDRLVLLPSFLNSLVTGMLKLENSWLEHFGFPLGVSVFAVAVKR